MIVELHGTRAKMSTIWVLQSTINLPFTPEFIRPEQVCYQTSLTYWENVGNLDMDCVCHSNIIEAEQWLEIVDRFSNFITNYSEFNITMDMSVIHRDLHWTRHCNQKQNHHLRNVK